MCLFAPCVLVAEETSFSRDVMTVLSKADCNAGACHGNQNGKEGFKLSLWGENPGSDFNALQSGGRLNINEPTASKVLLKPTLQVKHEGKKRFETGSAEYRVLLDWIRAGAAEDSNEVPHLESISVSPGMAMITAPWNSLALKVTATFSDAEPVMEVVA